MSNKPVSVFFSYSHKDEALSNELANHLEILKLTGVITTWQDIQILPGDLWSEEIQNNLNSAQVILLLVSANFIASKYCYSIEMAKAMERHEAGEARVIPVILEACLWPLAPFGKLQALPKNGTPITSKVWPTQAEAFTNVAMGIKKVADALQQLQVAKPVTSAQSAAQQDASKAPSEPDLLSDSPQPTPPQVERKELSDCSPGRLLFVKNVRDPGGGWAYSPKRLEGMPGSSDSRVFELFWLSTSRGATSASKGDLMLLNQHAKITHVVEMLDDEVRETPAGYFRWVRIVWMPELADWSQLPHQKEIFGFVPPTIGGGTAYRLTNLSKFKATWDSLEAFQSRVVSRLTDA